MSSLVYGIWRGMIRRCFDQGSPHFVYYGERGITVCERWLSSFAAFCDDMGPRPSRKYSVGRIDNDGNYEPGNCRWETAKQQSLNQRPGGTVFKDGKKVGPSLDYGTPTFCSESRCQARIYRAALSPRDTWGRPSGLWRFHDDAKKPDLIRETALCPQHSSPVHEVFTPEGRAALLAEAEAHQRAMDEEANSRLAKPTMPESLVRELGELYRKWKARQDDQESRSS